MNPKTRKIINWILTVFIGFIFIAGAFVKLSGSGEAEEMATGLGVSLETLTVIGVIELIAVVLFIIPRTAIIGTLLLAAYMGGAIATHVLQGEPFIFPAAIQAFVWIVAVLRFPWLAKTLVSKTKADNPV